MRSRTALGVTVALLSLSAAVLAQRNPQGTPPRYDVATEATMEGTIESVKQTPATARASGGLHLRLATMRGTFEVHVGPAAFTASKSFAFATGDAIAVTGSIVALEEGEVVLAREIRKGDQVLVLRDQKGFPLWSRRGRR